MSEPKKVFIWETVGVAKMSSQNMFIVMSIGRELYSLRTEDVIDLTAGYVRNIEVKKLFDIGGEGIGTRESKDPPISFGVAADREGLSHIRSRHE